MPRGSGVADPCCTNGCDCDNGGGGSQPIIDFGNLVLVATLNDLPTPVGNVITLAPNTTYMINGDLDLAGNRLVGSVDTAIIGTNPENCSLTSTLPIGESLLTSNASLAIQNIALSVSGLNTTILDLDALATPLSVLDWFKVNFTGGAIGSIANYENVVMQTIGVLAGVTDGFRFDGLIGSIIFETSAFITPNLDVGNAHIYLEPTLTVLRRVRITNCPFLVLPTQVGIDASLLTTIPTEGYIVTFGNFVGGGTYLQGLLPSDDRTRFIDNRGIENTFPNVFYTMTNNVLPTPITAVSIPEKVVGITTQNSVSQRFIAGLNQATYIGSLTRTFKITALATFSAILNQEVGLLIAINGIPVTESLQIATSTLLGRAENVTTQAIVQLQENDILEIYIQNNISTQNIVVEDLSVIAEVIGV